MRCNRAGKARFDQGIAIRVNVQESSIVSIRLGNPEGEAASDEGNAVRRRIRDIGVVLFDGFSLLTTGVIPEVFQVANEIHASRSNGQPLYEVRFYSAEGGSMVWSSSISVRTYPCDAERAMGFDALFIAGGEGAMRAARDRRVIDWLRRVLPLTAVVKAIGEGRVLLEAAGWRWGKLLPGRQDPGTLHRWAVGHTANHHGDRYEPEGTALQLVQRDLGIYAARKIAGRLSLDDAAVLAPAATEERGMTSAEKVNASAQWLEQNCEKAISVSDAARVAAMSERNFLRFFKQEIGVTPSEFLLQVRLERTLQLLTETDLAIDTIAKRCGWLNGDRLAKIFRKRMAGTPSEYRARARRERPDSNK
ncbi:Helix-turn-helix, AraC domain-containing protein [Burkholderia sp. lig30]|nr:Helix-turn-helix, AraC domain-containing protein [Burkholderia sp. lig30]